MLDCLLLPSITLAEGDSTRGRFNDVWSPEGREEAMRASLVRRIEGAKEERVKREKSLLFSLPCYENELI
jgi:hypothetical protein